MDTDLRAVAETDNGRVLIRDNWSDSNQLWQLIRIED